MRKVIDEQAAIDAVYERIRQIGCEHNTSVLSIIQVIRDLPSAQAEPTRIISETRAIPSDDDRVSLSEKVTATYYDEENEEWSRKIVTVRDVLDSVCDEYTVLPSAQPEPQWIPCSERLPEVNEELESASVLITYKNTYWTGATTTNITIAHYGERLLSSDGKYLDTPGWVGSKKYSVDDVLAWMPMPKPYIERREE